MKIIKFLSPPAARPKIASHLPMRCSITRAQNNNNNNSGGGSTTSTAPRWKKGWNNIFFFSNLLPFSSPSPHLLEIVLEASLSNNNGSEMMAGRQAGGLLSLGKAKKSVQASVEDIFYPNHPTGGSVYLSVVTWSNNGFYPNINCFTGS